MTLTINDRLTIAKAELIVAKDRLSNTEASFDSVHYAALKDRVDQAILAVMILEVELLRHRQEEAEAKLTKKRFEIMHKDK